ncbi:MAG: DUF559 domain-containing protein [bacterium]|nr:DUF559 domain-containing protein [bacterium]
MPKKLLSFTRALRKHQTLWESKLWSHLRSNNFDLKFKRQVRIGKYIVDFCCADKKLVIEIDGGYHNKLKNKIYDQEKDEFLSKEGYKILRIWNGEIENDFSKVLEKIHSTVK